MTAVEASHANGQCALSIENATKIAQLEKSDADQWTAINALRNRLPVWGTLVVSLLTFLLGFTLNMKGV